VQKVIESDSTEISIDIEVYVCTNKLLLESLIKIK